MTNKVAKFFARAKNLTTLSLSYLAESYCIKEQSTLSLAASALKKITYPESMEEFQLSEI